MNKPIHDSNSTPLRALVMSVGIASENYSDITLALKNDALDFDPDELILLASAESLANAERLAEMLDESKARIRIVKLKSAHDLEDTLRQVNSVIDELYEIGVEPENIAINYTSGTKMMSSGVVLSAVFNRCHELRYLAGSGGDGSDDRLVSTHPSAIFAYQDLLRARAQMLDLRFETARDVLGGINDSLLSERNRPTRIQMLRLAEAYHERLLFHPGRFLELYGEVDFEGKLVEPFRMSADQIEAVGRLADEMKHQTIGHRGLLEIYTDGRRRLRQGPPDDAVTRLYRSLEGLAQCILMRDFQIDTNNVDSKRIPPRDRIGYEALRSPEDGILKIGLRKSYDLLIVLETPVGLKYRGMTQLREFLAMRGRSILAHGLSPIAREDAQGLFRAARELFLEEIKDFDQACDLLQFPWLASAD